VQLTEESIDIDKWDVSVVGVSWVTDLDDFEVIIRENRTTIHTWDPLALTATGDHLFTDLDGGGGLSIGDYFTVACKPNSEYELVVFWRDSGNAKGSAEWET
jgi:hypothetical protein